MDVSPESSLALGERPARDNACPIRCVLFDLDGTLADTAPDLAYALNTLRSERGLSPLTFAEIRPHVSHGAAALVKLGFGAIPESPGFPALRQRLLDIYEAHLTRETRLFTGMDEVLAALESRAVKWGVVTNKPAWLTQPLLQQLGLLERAATVVSGDTTERKKPHPDPMFHAAKEAGLRAEECLYVGDAERDIEAGVRAGMRTLVALFGYLGKDDVPHKWGADGMVGTPTDILRWLGYAKD